MQAYDLGPRQDKNFQIAPVQLGALSLKQGTDGNLTLKIATTNQEGEYLLLKVGDNRYELQQDADYYCALCVMPSPQTHELTLSDADTSKPIQVVTRNGTKQFDLS